MSRKKKKTRPHLNTWSLQCVHSISVDLLIDPSKSLVGASTAAAPGQAHMWDHSFRRRQRVRKGKTRQSQRFGQASHVLPAAVAKITARELSRRAGDVPSPPRHGPSSLPEACVLATLCHLFDALHDTGQPLVLPERREMGRAASTAGHVSSRTPSSRIIAARVHTPAQASRPLEW